MSNQPSSRSSLLASHLRLNGHPVVAVNDYLIYQEDDCESSQSDGPRGHSCHDMDANKAEAHQHMDCAAQSGARL